MHNESYIQIALELAKKGTGYVSPKPLEGALLVKNNKIVGAAYRSKPAEENPVITALKNAKETVEDSILYTNLEPCITYKNEPDCTDLIIKSKIKKVVFGAVNPQPTFGGLVIKKLKKTGIEIKTGVLEKECCELNKFYFKHSVSRLPYVTLKMAATVDGKIADERGNSKWITSVESRSMVHQLRGEYDAVLVGIKTVMIDNPKLTVRLVEGRNPKRIILDAGLDINITSSLVKKNSDKNLIVLTSKKNRSKKRKLEKLNQHGVEVIFVSEIKNGRINLSKVLKKLGKRNITSLLVEGGGKIFTSFIKEKLEDEILIFIGPKILGQGISLTGDLGIKSLPKAFKYSIRGIDKVGEDALLKLVRR